jgi:type I restriction enzyme S subunit
VSSGKPIIRIQNLNDRDAKFNYSDVQHEDKYLVSNSDLLFAWSASLGAYIWNGQDAWLNQHIFKVHPSICVDKKFLYYLLTNVTAGLYAKAHGSGMVHVTKGKFEATEVFLPPLSEQHRIVAKIETLFSELDKGIESFKTAREQLKIYRQSLLKHAFSGKLTEQWRAENPDKLESAQALLQRIETERQQRYQQQLKNWEANDKQGSKPKALKTLPPLTTEELAELPEGWAWCRLGSTNVDVSDGPFGSNLKSSDYVDNGVRVIRLENIGALKFIEDKESYVTDAKYELLKNHTVSSGDIVFSSFITENVRVALVPQSITKAINKADCFCIRLYGDVSFNKMGFQATRSTNSWGWQTAYQYNSAQRPSRSCL